jgi:hypothetical protein
MLPAGPCNTFSTIRVTTTARIDAVFDERGEDRGR